MLLLLLILLCGCSRRFARLRRSGDVRVQVSMPSRRRTPEPVAAPQGDTTAASGPITFTTEDGRELRLVPAAYDDRLQESVMNLRIEQVTISVNNIRNVAERNGKIDLEFSVTLPRELLDDQWRVELEPVLCTRQDTFSLHRLLFTGERFRRLQRQDMARYDRYLHSIVDSADYFRCFADVAGFESYLHKAAVRRQALLEEKARLDAAAGNTVSGRSRLSDRRVYRRGFRDLRRQAARERRSRLDSVGALGRAAQGHPSDPLAAYLAPHYKPRPVETPGYVRAIRRELSDSSEVQRSRIRRRTVEANIRLLSDLDTAALMLEYYDLRKIERNEERDLPLCRTARRGRTYGPDPPLPARSGHVGRRPPLRTSGERYADLFRDFDDFVYRRCAALRAPHRQTRRRGRRPLFLRLFQERDRSAGGFGRQPRAVGGGEAPDAGVDDRSGLHHRQHRADGHLVARRFVEGQ